MVSRVASIQMTSSHEVSHNLAVAKKLIQQAVDQGAQLIVLPENFAFMGLKENDKLQHQEAFGEGPIQNFLLEEALKHKVWIVGGTIPVQGFDNKVYASCLVWNDQGKCVARYDKIHLFDVMLPGKEQYSESRATLPGKEVVVIETPVGKLGLGVCYDIRFPELFRSMLARGVELIALPTAFTYTTGKMHWEVLVRARAIENLSYMITACQTGVHSSGRKTYGNSMIVEPWGEVKECLPEGEGVVVAEVDLDRLHQLRTEFPALEHRRL